jgi:hypothetical protein
MIGQIMSLKNLTEWKFNTNQSFSVKPNRDGTSSRDIMTDITFDVNFSGGTLVFETEPIENYSPFYETPETFTIVGERISLRITF